jgi:acetoin utilization protein AcuB
MDTDEPMVQEFMSAQPYWIHAGAPLDRAKAVMAEHGIRHLPVMNNLTVMGIISQRDINLALGLEGTNPARLVVMDMCHGRPYIVAPRSPLREVAAEMAARGIGSAIVMDGTRLVGIFTTVDACRALAAVLTPLRPCRADIGA